MVIVFRVMVDLWLGSLYGYGLCMVRVYLGLLSV